MKVGKLGWLVAMFLVGAWLSLKVRLMIIGVLMH